VNHHFEQFCTLDGIDLQHTITYPPLQNIVAKRKNRFLKEMVCCMIHARSLAPTYWAKAINCVAHIHNRFLHKALKGITPFESWCGKKPVVQHFKVFGSLTWPHIPSKIRKALEPQIQNCIFVCYPMVSKDIRSWILRHMISSLSVVCNLRKSLLAHPLIFLPP
jgi:hypothetical protein